MELTPNPHCGANLRSRDGTCGHQAGWGTDHPGSGHCKLHGGSTQTGRKHAKQIREEAWLRILDMVDPALTELLRQVTMGETDGDRFRAVKDVLDRGGLGAKYVHEHTGPDGGPIPIEVRAAELAQRARALRPPAAKVTRKKASVTGKKASPASPGSSE